MRCGVLCLLCLLCCVFALLCPFCFVLLWFFVVLCFFCCVFLLCCGGVARCLFFQECCLLLAHADMQAFKAANPGCTLVDFVRWLSPADIISLEGGGYSLSARMLEPGNIWLLLWEVFGLPSSFSYVILVLPVVCSRV